MDVMATEETRADVGGEFRRVGKRANSESTVLSNKVRQLFHD